MSHGTTEKTKMERLIDQADYLRELIKHKDGELTKLRRSLADTNDEIDRIAGKGRP